MEHHSKADPGVDWTPPRRSAIPPWKRPAAVLVLCTAAVAGGGVGGVVESGLNPAETVSGAVASALGGSTASLSIHESVSEGGNTLSIAGSGVVDFANGDAEESVTEPSAGAGATVEVVEAGSVVYVRVPQLGQVDPGKSWLSIDFSALSKDERAAGLSGLGLDPASALRLIGAQGNTVSPLGSSTVDGQSVQGYAISYNVAAIENEFAATGLPAWERSLLAQVDLTKETSTVYVNSSDQLVRVANAIGLTAGEQAGTANGWVDFSDYGAPVSVSAPPAGEVVPFAQFLQSLGGMAQ